MSDAACENLQPHVMQALARQLKSLANAPPEGIRYIPTDSITEIVCEIDGPTGTPYEGGTFQVKLLLGNEYPTAPPKGYFITRIFHPNIANNGDICVNTLKKDWKPEHTLSHVLQVIRCLLIVPFPESSLNDDAGKLFMESYDEYARKARLMTSIHAQGNSSSASNTGSTTTSTTASTSTTESSSSSTHALSTNKNSNTSTVTESTTAVKKVGNGTSASSSSKEGDNSKEAEKKKKSLKRL